MYDREKVENFQIRMEGIIEKHDTKNAFELITSELNACENQYLTEFMVPLNFLKYEPVLDWVEQNVQRVENVTQAWGHLSASSNFTWERAEKWLKMGRPWSLVALDATMFCTTLGERLNQSLWMREINPKLMDKPKLDRIANGLKKYLETDSVPRTKNTVNRIINDIFEIG
ncbi:hypothetical protein [Mesoflavibacter profundi]|uniref:hypothetical protein n=1 Tax=Mesoflavibacter profundi TaxID=2708110 RepID=UPI00168A52E2|nr:hypothetical protein [Mesoflavibacter profundi]